MVNVVAPFRLPTVANLDMVSQTGLKSRLKRKKMRRLNGGDSEPVKWTQGNNPSGVFTRGGLSSPNPQAKYLGFTVLVCQYIWLLTYCVRLSI